MLDKEKLELISRASWTLEVLFLRLLGRPQSSASYPFLLRLVRNKILFLHKDTLLFPGHGPVASVKEVRLHNPFFDFDD